MARDFELSSGNKGAVPDDHAARVTTALAAALVDHDPTAPIIAAVSGGSDSTALLLALADGRAASPEFAKREVLVVTIDHNLRTGSADDAAFVQALAARHGLDAELCVWRGPKPDAGLQAKARKARYAMLIVEAERRWPGRQTLILTAHTQEDQAETVLMRLARGSGPAGLAAMVPWRALKGDGDCRLVRPFLDLTRQDLRDYLKLKGETWRDDPSNESEAFERVRWRKLADTLAGAGMTSSALATTAKRMARADAALRAMTDRAFSEIDFNGHGGGFATFDGAAFLTLPDDIASRALTRVLDAFGGAARKAEMAAVEDLCGALASAIRETRSYHSSLGGCLIEFSNEAEVFVFREPGRFHLVEVPAAGADDAIWDERLRLKRASGLPESTSIRPLAAATPADLKAHCEARLSPDCELQAWPATALATWPGLFRDDGDLLQIALPAGSGCQNTSQTEVRPVFSAQWLHRDRFKGPVCGR